MKHTVFIKILDDLSPSFDYKPKKFILYKINTMPFSVLTFGTHPNPLLHSIHMTHVLLSSASSTQVRFDPYLVSRLQVITTSSRPKILLDIYLKVAVHSVEVNV